MLPHHIIPSLIFRMGIKGAEVSQAEDSKRVIPHQLIHHVPLSLIRTGI